jgi:hypothetical protein
VVVVSTRYLRYSAPVFNPESYYHHIRHKFDLFYEGDASPPETAFKNESANLVGDALRPSPTPASDSILFQAVYDPAQRLEQRGEIERAVREWAGGVNLAGL